MIPFYTLKITTRRVIDDQFLPNKKIKTASTVITTKYLFDLLLRFIHSATEIKLPADKKKTASSSMYRNHSGCVQGSP